MEQSEQYRITSTNKNTLIEIGIERFNFLRYYRLIFLPVFIGLLVVLTIQFLMIFPISVIFTIPFWYLCILMIIGNINSFTETQIIEINASHLVLTKKRPILPYIISIPLNEIQEVNLKSIELRLGKKKFKKETWLVWMKGFKNYVQLPAIKTNNSTYYFFEYSHIKEDKLKLIAQIKDILNTKNAA